MSNGSDFFIKNGALLKYCGDDGDVVIPDGVIIIGEMAFRGRDITSVVIPNSVTTIGEAAFNNCCRLSSVTIPDSVTVMGDYVFSGCDRLTSVTIGNSVTSIGKSAFLNCSLTNVVIPDSVTSIGDYAFQGCRGLASVTIGDSVTAIGNYAFRCCGLTSVTIPDSVTTIGIDAFCDCRRLTNVTIPDSVINIGSYAFYNCESLISVAIGNGVKNIESYAFQGTAIENNKSNWRNGVLYIGRWLIKVKEDIFVTYTVPDGTVGIADGAFSSCHGLTNVFIPNSVTAISDSAFQGCSRLTSVIIPDSVTSIGIDAFCSCKSLANVTIGNGVTSISHGVFENCVSLTSVVIPDGITSIDKGAFKNCSGLTSVTIPRSMTSLNKWAFENCSSLAGIWVDRGNSYYSSDKYGVLFNKNRTELIKVPNTISEYSIPDSITCLGDRSFEGCSNLSSVVIPDSVTSICKRAFEGNKGLKSVVIPDSVTCIDDWAFKGCSNLMSVVIPDSVTYLGARAFEDCSSLKSVTIGEVAADYIDQYTFVGCRRLEGIYFTGDAPDYLELSDEKVKLYRCKWSYGWSELEERGYRVALWDGKIDVEKTDRLKSYNFPKAKVNIVNYIEADTRERKLEMDDTVVNFASSFYLRETFFVGNKGRYVCSSSMVKWFVNNPLGIDMNAVSAISKVLDRLLTKNQEFLMGWHLYDSGKGNFVFSFSACGGDYIDSKYARSFVYNPDTGVVESPVKPKSLVSVLESALPALITSIMKVGIPIDLFEVCLIGGKYSEEGHYNNGGYAESYLFFDDMGFVDNTTHVLNGISVITEGNGFNKHEFGKLMGKYALLVVC